MTNYSLFICTLVLFTSLSHAATIPSSSPNVLQDQYISLSKENDWSGAVTIANALKELSPTKGENWDRLSQAYFQNGLYQDATEAAEKALNLGYKVDQQALRIAKIHIKQGDTHEALQWLLLSRKNKLRNAEFLFQSDKLISPLLQNKKYRKALFPKVTENASRYKKWSQDITFLDIRARETHDSLFDHISMQAWENEIESLKKTINDKTDLQIRAQITRLLARVGDGHTLPYAIFNGPDVDSMIPLGFYEFQDGIFVISASEEYKQLVGQQLISVNGHPINTVLERLKVYISSDNEMNTRWMAATSLSFLWMLEYADVVSGEASVVLGLSSQNKRENVTIKSEAFSFDQFGRCCKNVLARAFSPRAADATYHYSFDDENGILRIDYHSVVNDPNRPLEDFLKKVVSEASERKPEATVLDLRNNNGGNGTLNPMTMKYLLQLESLTPEQRFFVLIGRSTFSAAMNLSSYLERWTNAIFIGEPTGSSPNFTGENDLVVLPNSGLTISISSRHWLGAYSDDQRKWLAPDVHISVSSTDYFSGNDKAFQTIVNRVKK